MPRKWMRVVSSLGLAKILSRLFSIASMAALNSCKSFSMIGFRSESHSVVIFFIYFSKTSNIVL